MFASAWKTRHAAQDRLARKVTPDMACFHPNHWKITNTSEKSQSFTRRSASTPDDRRAAFGASPASR
jgi:hypothetical protein